MSDDRRRGAGDSSERGSVHDAVTDDVPPPDEPATADAPRKGTFGWQQVIALIVTLVVLVVVFAVVLPQLGDYDDAWQAIQDLSAGWLAALLAVTVVNIVIYVFPYQAALPGLGYRQAFVVRQTSFMISNVIPAGGAIGIGVQYAMLSGYGQGPAPATAVIGVTSTWNTMVTLCLPVVALTGLAVTGQADAVATTVAVVGLVVVAVMIGALASILRNEGTARRIGDLASRGIAALARMVGRTLEVDAGRAVVEFRNSIVGVVARRWHVVTATNLLQQLAQFSVLWVALVAVQGGSSEATLVEAFAAFAFARLATFIPVPPGGLGTTDAALTAILQAFGVGADLALAAVLVWRAATYLPQVFIGIATFATWRLRRRRRSEAPRAG